MNIPAKLEERVSKNENPYFCIVIKITDEVEKLFFLDNAEIELIRLTYGNSQKVKINSNNLKIRKSLFNEFES